jgi:hypothetical protein
MMVRMTLGALTTMMLTSTTMTAKATAGPPEGSGFRTAPDAGVGMAPGGQQSLDRPQAAGEVRPPPRPQRLKPNHNSNISYCAASTCNESHNECEKQQREIVKVLQQNYSSVTVEELTETQ